MTDASPTDLRPRFPVFLTVFTVAVLVFGTTLYYFLLAFHFDWLQAIPGWFFQRKDRFDIPYQVWPLVLMLVATCLVIFFAFWRRRAWWLLPVSIALFYFLQVGYGLVSGAGFEAIRQKYARAAISEELVTVCQSKTGFSETIRRYDSLYDSNFWYGTKPPGFVSVYMLMRDAVGFFRPAVQTDPQACFLTLTKNFAVFLPLAAALTLIPLFFTARLLSPDWPHLPGLVYFSAPSAVLMTLLADQYLFPLLFAVFLLILALAVTRRSPAFAFLTGATAYGLIFVSFSLLPVFGLALFWFGLDYFLNPESHSLRSVFTLLLAFAAGAALTAGLMWLMFGYNFLARYLTAFQHHRAIKQFDFSASSILAYVILNHADFTLWTGFGFLFLFYLASARALVSIIHRQANRHDVFRTAFFLTFVLLNVIGQTRSEVGRLWLFLLPGMALSFYPEALTLFKKPWVGFALFYAAQLASVFMVFYYIHFP